MKDGDYTLSSFRHALAAQQAGWKVHDIMIYLKKNTPFTRSNAYTRAFEFMHVFANGKPARFNPIREKSKWAGHYAQRTRRRQDGTLHRIGSSVTNPTKVRTNVWPYSIGMGNTTADDYAFDHPAMFPEKLAEDHVVSWSDPGDIVFDPMCGSGTVLKMAKLNGRKYAGCDASERFVAIARRRVAEARQRKLFYEQEAART